MHSCTHAGISGRVMIFIEKIRNDFPISPTPLSKRRKANLLLCQKNFFWETEFYFLFLNVSSLYYKHYFRVKDSIQHYTEFRNTLQKFRKLILGSCFILLPRPLPLPLPLPRPLPRPRKENDFPCFISTNECSSSSQRMHPLYKVAPSFKGVVFLLKSTSNIVESHSGQRLRVVVIL